VRFVVVDQREEERIRLALAGGAIAGAAIDDAALVVEKALRVRLPQRPRLRLRVAALEAGQKRQRKQAG